MTDQYPHRLAQFVASETAERRWSDREMGRRLGLNHVTLGNIINGATRNPDEATLDKLATLREGVDRSTLRRWLHEAPVPVAVGAGHPAVASVAAGTSVPEPHAAIRDAIRDVVREALEATVRETLAQLAQPAPAPAEWKPTLDELVEALERAIDELPPEERERRFRDGTRRTRRAVLAGSRPPRTS